MTAPTVWSGAGSHADGEEVVSASVQSLVRRLERFSPHDFGLIICDEAHHAAANTYRKIFEYFQPLKLVGFTATPNRGDKIRLSDVFQKIIFQRDLRWGIQNKYLCDILCKRVDIGYDLRAVHTRNGDYAPGELDEAMEGTADAIAQTYREHAAGATLIFAVSVHQAEEIAGRIKGAVVVTGETKDRAAIIEAFTAGEIPCIVNCMVFTEGTDIPRVETVIVARPTQSESLYAQMVGRGLRLYPGKERLVLIDCVGITGKASLCTAPSCWAGPEQYPGTEGHGDTRGPVRPAPEDRRRWRLPGELDQERGDCRPLGPGAEVQHPRHQLLQDAGRRNGGIPDRRQEPDDSLPQLPRPCAYAGWLPGRDAGGY